MGALPKRKISTRRKGKRRINHKVVHANTIKCSQCSADRLSHQACPECGFYKAS